MDESLLIDAATRVKSGVTSLTEAAKSIGFTVEQFQAKLGELLALKNRFGITPLTMDARHIVRTVQQMAPVLESEVAPIAGGLAVTEGSTGVLATIAGWLGISVGTLAVGALVVGTLAVGGAIYLRSRTAAAASKPAETTEVPTDPTETPTDPLVVPTNPAEIPAKPADVQPGPCAPLVKEARLCPWSPKSAAAKPCGPGFCFDGGFNGSLACKQEQLPDNAVRLDLDGVRCKPGFREQHDRCTGVLTACVIASDLDTR